MIRVPFDVELAKKITNGKVDGRIVTREGKSVRIVCWNKIDKTYPIVGLEDNGFEEYLKSYTTEGIWDTDSCKNNSLMLEIPEYMTFKDGDVLSYDGGKFILKRIDGKDRAEYYANFYGIYTAFDSACSMKNFVNHLRLATEEERKILINALKKSKRPEAKKYLKRFFGIEEKPEYEFKPFDKVLVRNSLEMDWIPRFFERATQCSQSVRYITLDNNSWKYCIPYNEHTAHLLGTIESLKE